MTQPQASATPLTRSDRRVGAALACGAVALLAGGCLLAAGWDGDTGGADVAAASACGDAVADRLGVPGATESPTSVVDASPTATPFRFVVASSFSHVDEAGERLRTPYTCTVTSVDGVHWTLVDLATSP